MKLLEQMVLASGNRGKLADFQVLFAGSGLELLLAADVGVALDVEETGASFEENARIKARAVADACDRPALGDDSGLCVDALAGRPGIFSARYAGPECDDRRNNRRVLEELGDRQDREAAFVCVLVLALPGGDEVVAEGRCQGTIAREARGQNGFGYDPIFFCKQLGGTFGEVSQEAKNCVSHRGAAVSVLLGELLHRGLLKRSPHG